MNTIRHTPHETELLDNFTVARMADKHHTPNQGKGARIIIKLDVYPDGRVHLSDGANRALGNEPYDNDRKEAWINLADALHRLYDRAVEETRAYQMNADQQPPESDQT